MRLFIIVCACIACFFVFVVTSVEAQTVKPSPAQTAPIPQAQAKPYTPAKVATQDNSVPIGAWLLLIFSLLAGGSLASIVRIRSRQSEKESVKVPVTHNETLDRRIDSDVEASVKQADDE